MPFLNKKVNLQIHTKRQFQIMEDLYYKADDGYVLTVPALTITDFASIFGIPVASFFIAVNGEHRLAAALHDWLYGVQGKFSAFKDGHEIKLDLGRAGCDKIFLEAMESLGVSYIERKTMYAGVRLGGWLRWRSAGKSK